MKSYDDHIRHGRDTHKHTLSAALGVVAVCVVARDVRELSWMAKLTAGQLRM